MSAVSETTVREYFELHGFVREPQMALRIEPARKKKTKNIQPADLL
jgi:hypothetical protein